MAHPIPKATDSSLCNVWRNVIARDVEGRPDISTVGAVSSRYLPLSISRNTPQCTRAGREQETDDKLLQQSLRGPGSEDFAMRERRVLRVNC